MNFSLPSKTFLVGEYGVLAEGGALLLNTLPRFKFQNNQFFDPHKQKGGFGASSAQWLFEYISYCDHKTEKLALLNKGLNANLALKLRNKYQQDIVTTFSQKKNYSKRSDFSFAQLGTTPSGVDVLSQCVGHIAYIHVKKRVFTSIPWPFQSLNFLIIPTGNKAVTQWYLDKGIDFKACQKLAQKSQKVINAFYQVKMQEFLERLSDFDKSLEKFNFCCKETLEIKRKIKGEFPDLFVKGCGALGMDTLLIVCTSDLLLDIKDFLQRNILLAAHQRHIITNNDLTNGLQED